MDFQQQSPRPGSGGKRVLPPISSDTDRQFLEKLQEAIDAEIVRLNCPDTGPDEQRYIIYKDAFNKVSAFVCKKKKEALINQTIVALNVFRTIMHNTHIIARDV